ncbi:hypothetical protein CK489_28265 [Bradyrhizobium sp. UFLA03-84]|nr:hypothetical protein CK489_28265 [Bradyrhizobium sp. UFLA03-84]
MQMRIRSVGPLIHVMMPGDMRAMAARCDEIANGLIPPDRAIVQGAAAQWRMLAHQTEMLQKEWQFIRGSPSRLGACLIEDGPSPR